MAPINRKWNILYLFQMEMCFVSVFSRWVCRYVEAFFFRLRFESQKISFICIDDEFVNILWHFCLCLEMWIKCNWIRNKLRKITCAWSGFRHVANICFVGLFNSSNCLTMPKPRPRLHPVIKIEFMFEFYLALKFWIFLSFSLFQYRICSSNQRISGQTTQSNVFFLL